MLKLKERSCKYCKHRFTPERTGQIICANIDCAIGWAEKIASKRSQMVAKDDRKVLRERKERLKSKNEWLREAQQQVNRYVRLRDRFDGCISCNKPASWGGQWHASHLRSTKAASAVRFNLWNIHKACSECNNFLSGNIYEFEPRLRAKIGNEKVDWLRTQNQTVNYSIEYLKRIKGIFKRKCARLEKRL